MEEEWKNIQKKIASQVNINKTLTDIFYVGGMDISYSKNDKDTVACLTIFEYPSLQFVYAEFFHGNTHVPYIPGYLSFRELSLLSSVYKNLIKKRPDIIPQIIFIDGNGTLHPRMAGIASHFGVTHSIPTIGVAKNFLSFGKLNLNNVRLESKGNYFILSDNGIIYGAAVLSSDKAKNPIFVSVGHGTNLQQAIELTLKCCIFRVPEPIRQADILSRQNLL